MRQIEKEIDRSVKFLETSGARKVFQINLTNCRKAFARTPTKNAACAVWAIGTYGEADVLQIKR